MRQRRELATGLLLVSLTAASLHAQVSTRLIGIDRVAFRGGADGPVRYDALILSFGAEPSGVVSAEFRLTYDRSAEPQTGTLELVITDGPDDTTMTNPLLVRRTLTWEEFIAFGTSEVIKLENLNTELVLVESQRAGIQRRAAKWSGQL